MSLAGLNIIVCHKTVQYPVVGVQISGWYWRHEVGSWFSEWWCLFVLHPDYDKPMSTLLMNTLKYSILAASDQQEPEDKLGGSNERMK